MKVKLIIFCLVVGLILLRLVVNELAEPYTLDAKPVAVMGSATQHVLPRGTWGQKKTEGEEKLEQGYKPMPEKYVSETEEEALPVQIRRERPIVESMTAEQFSPTVAALLSENNHLEIEDRKQQLVAFIDSVDPSIVEVQQGLELLAGQDIDPARKTAYQQLAEQKISALQELKEKAVALNNRLSVNTKAYE